MQIKQTQKCLQGVGSSNKGKSGNLLTQLKITVQKVSMKTFSKCDI